MYFSEVLKLWVPFPYWLDACSNYLFRTGWFAVVCALWRIGPLYQNCQICVWMIVHSIPLLSFFMSAQSIVISYFILNIGNLYAFSFFSLCHSFVNTLSISLIFFEEWVLCFIDFFLLFFCFQCCGFLLFIISFIVLVVDFILFFIF